MRPAKIAANLFALVMAAIWAIPLFWMLVTAFLEQATHARPQWSIGLENFRIVLETAPFGLYFINSLVIVFGIIVIQCLCITLAAYAFARLRFIGREIVFVLLLLQIVIPNDVLIVPNYQTVANLGLVNSLPGIMIPFFASAFGIFLLRQTFKSIPRDFEEAAAIDGCKLWGKLWHVFIPMSAPAYLAFALVSISTHWNDFLWPLIITSADAVRPMTVGLAMFATTFETGARWGEVSAATLLVSGPLLILFAIFQKRFVESFSYSAGLK